MTAIKQSQQMKHRSNAG